MKIRLISRDSQGFHGSLIASSFVSLTCIAMKYISKTRQMTAARIRMAPGKPQQQLDSFLASVGSIGGFSSAGGGGIGGWTTSYFFSGSIRPTEDCSTC